MVITPSLQITNQLAAAFGYFYFNKNIYIYVIFPILSNHFRREPTKSFYVKHNVVTEDAANRFVEASRLINQGREIGDLAENLVIVNAQKFSTNSSIDWGKLDRKSFNLLIVDEAHHFPAPTWNKIVSYFNCKILFLTATPFRKGQAILSEQNGSICYQISINELINNGVIRKTIFREIGNDRDKITEQKTVRDFLSCLIQFFLFFQLLSSEILRVLNEHDQCDPTVYHQAMVLTTDINEANRFAKLLNTTVKRDIAASYTGDTKNSDSILRQFEEEKGKNE